MKPKKFSSGKTDPGFMHIQRDVCVEANLKEVGEVGEQGLNVVSMPEPVIDVVRQVCEGSSCYAVRSLCFGAAILLTVWEHGRLNQADGGPNG